MFGIKRSYSIANLTRKKKQPSKIHDLTVLFAVSFSFGVVAWHLIRPIIELS